MSRPTPPARAGRSSFVVALALFSAVPALWLRAAQPDLSHAFEALLFGIAIVGAAFLLSWAAEVAQLDISAGLAIAGLALITVLPEYAVDFVFAWQGGESVQAYGPTCPSGEPGVASPCSLALANMTGANRLLIGLGWTSVVFIAWFRTWTGRKTAATPTPRWSGVVLERTHTVELAFLATATLYSLTLPLKSSITLIDSAVLLTLFALYTVRLTKAPPQQPHLVGPALWLGSLPTVGRRIAIAALAAWAAIVILLCAERFAHALVETGHDHGISEFFLVQWLAPLASEAPEFIVAGLFAWRLQTGLALGALVSSKVNQWTLLVGSLPIVFAISSASRHGLPIAGAQSGELLLTAAQSLFAVAMLMNLRMSLGEAGWIFGLFWAQFAASLVGGERFHDEVLMVTSLVYLVAGVAILWRHRADGRRLLRDGFRTPYTDLIGVGGSP
jgi:cation:H+ antiporter